MEKKIETPETLVVDMRNGAEVTVKLEDIPADILAQAALMGLGQKVRNFAASALMNCRTSAAGPKRNDESDEAYKKRVESMTVGTEALLEESQSCMEAGLKRLYEGDWGAERSTGGTASDPLDKWRLMVMRDIMKSNAALKELHDAIPSEDQKGRRALLLEKAAMNAEAIDPLAEQRRDASKVKVAKLDL